MNIGDGRILWLGAADTTFERLHGERLSSVWQAPAGVEIKPLGEIFLQYLRDCRMDKMIAQRGNSETSWFSIGSFVDNLGSGGVRNPAVYDIPSNSLPVLFVVVFDMVQKIGFPFLPDSV